LLKAVGKDVEKLIKELKKILNAPKGVDLVGFLQQVIKALEELLQKILQAVSKLIEQLLGDLTKLDLLEGILSDLKVVSIIGKLLDTLKQILEAVKGIKL
jgi:hypothetical protein